MTMMTMEIGVWVRAPGALLWRVREYNHQKNIEIIIAKILQSSAFWRYLNTVTMGTAFPHFPLETTPEMLFKKTVRQQCLVILIWTSMNTYLDKYDKRNDYFIFS